MIKKNITFYGFIVSIFLIFVFFSLYIIFGLNDSTDVLQKNGFIFSLDSKKNKVLRSDFKKGNTISFKKFGNSISIEGSKSNKNFDLNNVLIYNDKSISLLNDSVGVDPTTINSDIIFYYNFFKGGNLNFENGNYVFKNLNDKISFKSLLLRLDKNKYFVKSNDIRIMYSDDKIVNVGDYAYIEYNSGDVANVYNDKEVYNVISENAKLVFDNVYINLITKEVYYEGVKKISLTNLVLNNDENINLLSVDEDAAIGSSDISSIDMDGGNSNGDSDFIDNNSSSVATTDGDNSSDMNNDSNDDSDDDSENGDQNVDDNQEEESVNVTYKTPKFKVSALNLSALKIDALINISDDDEVLSSDVTFSIIQNSNFKVVYEETLSQGEIIAEISYANLKPDTEYTLVANANFTIEGEEYNRNFLSKIFRTEDLGLSVEKSYATSSSLVFDFIKENYSKVDSCLAILQNEKGDELSAKSVDFNSSNIVSLSYDELDSNQNYVILLTDIKSEGITVDKGFEMKKTFKTLKAVPVINDLSFRVDKKNSLFTLGVSGVTDKDYGIKSYRWEIVEANGDILTNPVIKSIDRDNFSSINVDVDGTAIQRNVGYTFRLVVIFDDNDKEVEYVKYCNEIMSLDGLKFPTIRFDYSGCYVTWEQINGVILIDDEYGTIVSDNFKVVVKNSIGVSQTLSIISNANGIPISINGLRANETYMFDVYATLNLNDGNVDADYVYIGSCSVQTGKPNALRAYYSLLPAYNTPFSFNLTLSDPNGLSSSLEASTLSEITVSIYNGENITSDKQIYRRVVDTNDEDYISTIAEMMYNKACLINPDFFNAKNSEFYDTKYTLVLSDAHDYTKYKNEIPIENNVYTFDINTYIPNIPDDVNDTISYFKIYNRNAASYGGKIDDTLNPNTVVGYAIKADFDNNTGSARYVEYSVHKYNPSTKNYEEIEELQSTVSYEEDGSLPYKIYWVKNGSTDSNNFSVLHRGDSFKFSYKVFLDFGSSGDGTLKEYPSILDKNTVLFSKTLTDNKQLPVITMYPSLVYDKTAVWKYKISDIDLALADNKLFAYNGSKLVSSALITSESEEFEEVTFTNLSTNSKYDIMYNIKTTVLSSPQNSLVASDYIYSQANISSINYSVSEKTNELLISIDNYYSQEILNLMNSVITADVTIVPKKAADLERLGEKKFSNLEFVSGEIYISYFDIEKYVNVDFDVIVDVYYDTDIHGFDVDSEYVSIQKFDGEGNKNFYKYKNSNLAVSSLNDSMYNYEFDNSIPSLYLSNLKFNVPIELNNSGVIYKTNNIILKKIDKFTLNSSSKSFKFTSIIPGISLLKNNKLAITALLDTASFEIFTKIPTGVVIKDDLFYIDLYTTDKNGLNPVYEKTYEKNINSFNKPVVLADLFPGVHYQMKIRCSYKYQNDSVYTETYLYDYSYKILGYRYNFSSLETVVMNNFTYEFDASSYSNKNLIINYDLDTLFGFDHISYDLYHLVDGKYVKVDAYLPNSTYFLSKMRISVNANPSTNNVINYGEKYKLVCTPIAIFLNDDGTKQVVNLGTTEYSFKIADYKEPIIGISKGESETSLYFKVSISDISHVIYQDYYSYELYDVTEKKVISQKDDLKTSNLNARFDFNKNQLGLSKDHTYRFTVKYLIDKEGTTLNLKTYTKYRESVYGKNVDLGTITAYNSSDNKSPSITFVYSDSYNLNIIKNLYITFVNYDLGYYYSKNIPVSLTYDSSKNQYSFKFDIEDDVELNGDVYIVTINYYDESNNLLEQSESSIYL